MNSYRPASIASTTTKPVIPISDSIIDVRTESTEVGECGLQASEDRAIDQVHQEYEFEWAGEKSIIEIANSEEVGATDEVIVKGIFNIAQNGTKSISQWEYWVTEVEDHTIQLAAWKMLAQMKGHFDQKKKKDARNKNIKYILIPDWK